MNGTTKSKRTGTIWTAPLRWFGRNSYEVYITHMFFVMALSEILFDANQPIFLVILWYGVALVLSGIFGQLTSSFFSEPMNRFIRKRTGTIQAVMSNADKVLK